MPEVVEVGTKVEVVRESDGTVVVGPPQDVVTQAELDAHVSAADPHVGYQLEAEKGVAGGYASLDGNGLLPDAQIPGTITRDTELAAHEADMTAVHGIADTSVLETTTGAQAKVNTHVNDAIDAHDGSAVSVNPTGLIVVTTSDVQAALAQLDGAVVAVRPARSTFSDANYTVLATDRYVAQVGTMTADRTVTLPAANAVAAGQRITIADESGSLAYDTRRLIITRAGSDTITDPRQKQTTITSFNLDAAFAAIELISNGSNRWTVVGGSAHQAQFKWWQGGSAQMPLAVPNNTWVPVPWGITGGLDPYGLRPSSLASTTIPSSMNGLTLPRSTIDLTDASAFPSAGYILIDGPPGAGTKTIVRYTGKTGNQLTGCNTGIGAGISTGTLATGQAVTQAFVEFGTGHVNYLWNTIVDIAFAQHATGNRGVRFRSIDGVFNFPLAANHAATGNIDNQHVQCSMQNTGGPLEAPTRIEVFQTSGGVLNIKTDGISAPIIMGVVVASGGGAS